VRLLRQSPKIERLEADWLIEFDNDQWAKFLDALAKCPFLTTVTGIGIGIDFGCLTQLKDTLNRHWSQPEKKEVPKKLDFVVDASIGVDYGQQVAFTIEAFRRWADDVKCQLDWRPSCESLTIDCSNSDAIAPPAPGLYGEITRQLVADATGIVLKLGGTALHDSWRDKLIFHKARRISIFADEDARTSALIDSIPTWLTERNGATSRCFPAVEQLTVRSSSLFLAELRAASSKLRPFLGRLTTLKRVDLDGVSSFAAASEPLSYFAVGELDEVECCEPIGCVVCERPADASGTLGDRCPRIHRLTSSHLRSKAGVAEFIKLALAVRPVSVELVAVLDESELEGKRKATKLADLRSFADECAMRVTPHYTVEKSECELVGWKKYCLGIKHT